MTAMTKIAVAAAILIAVTALISWLAPNSGTALAFANVAEALNKLESTTWKTEQVVRGPDNQTAKWTTTEHVPCAVARTERDYDGRRKVHSHLHHRRPEGQDDHASSGYENGHGH